MGSRNSALAVSCYGNRNEHLCDGPLRSNEHFCYQLTSTRLLIRLQSEKKPKGFGEWSKPGATKLQQPERVTMGITTPDLSWKAPRGGERALPAPIANFFLRQIS